MKVKWLMEASLQQERQLRKFEQPQVSAKRNEDSPFTQGLVPLLLQLRGRCILFDYLPLTLQMTPTINHDLDTVDVITSMAC